MFGEFSAQGGLLDFAERWALGREIRPRQGVDRQYERQLPLGYVLVGSKDGRFVITVTGLYQSADLTSSWGDRISFGEIGENLDRTSLMLHPIKHPLAFDRRSPVAQALLSHALKRPLSNEELAAGFELAAELSENSPLKGRRIAPDVAQSLVAAQDKLLPCYIHPSEVPASFDELVALVDGDRHDGGGVLRF